jgi:hypothetical protein
MMLFLDSGAEFSKLRSHRYRLWRRWDSSLPAAVFCLMNPSTADELTNDPTIERCMRRVAIWNRESMRYGSVEIVNVFAWRETDSKMLPQRIAEGIDIIGVRNDAAILAACAGAGIVICGWGNPGNLMNRGKDVLALMRMNNIKPCALKLNKDGTPQHPLYIGYDVAPVEIEHE